MPLPPHSTVGFTNKIQPPLARNFLPPKFESSTPKFPFKDRGEKKRKEKEEKKSVKLAKNA